MGGYFAIANASAAVRAVLELHRLVGIIELHESVADAAVVGVPDEKWGEAITALVEPHAGSEIDEAARELDPERLRHVLAAHARELLGLEGLRVVDLNTKGRMEFHWITDIEVWSADGRIVSPCGGRPRFCAAFREPWAQALAEERIVGVNFGRTDVLEIQRFDNKLRNFLFKIRLGPHGVSVPVKVFVSIDDA